MSFFLLFQADTCFHFNFSFNVNFNLSWSSSHGIVRLYLLRKLSLAIFSPKISYPGSTHLHKPGGEKLELKKSKTNTQTNRQTSKKNNNKKNKKTNKSKLPRINPQTSRRKTQAKNKTKKYTNKQKEVSTDQPIYTNQEEKNLS